METEGQIAIVDTMRTKNRNRLINLLVAIKDERGLSEESKNEAIVSIAKQLADI